MSWLNSAPLVLLERYLDVTTMRQTLVTTNLANVDTPGYHTHDVDFRGELWRAMNGEDTSTTSPFVMTCGASSRGRTATTSAWTGNLCCWRKCNLNSSRPRRSCDRNSRS